MGRSTISRRPRACRKPARAMVSDVAGRYSIQTFSRPYLRSLACYLMLDANRRVIYVGKAKDLRDRVGSYYSQPLGYTRKMDGLLESIASIDVRVVGSELEALMLESQLIKRYQPKYNKVMRSHEQYPYIKIDLASPWPRILLAPEWKNDGARYFGPYRNRGASRQVVDLLNKHFQLRTCTRSFKTARSYGSPCLKLSLKQCLGPCAGKADREIYTQRVRDCVQFLEGDDAPLLQRIWEQLERAATNGDFEQARRLRRDIQTLQSISGVHRAIQEMERRPTLLLALPHSGSRPAGALPGGGRTNLEPDRNWAARIDRSHSGATRRFVRAVGAIRAIAGRCGYARRSVHSGSMAQQALGTSVHAVDGRPDVARSNNVNGVDRPGVRNRFRAMGAACRCGRGYRARYSAW